MAYRILVDENTSPRVAELLRGKGHVASSETCYGTVPTTVSTIAIAFAISQWRRQRSVTSFSIDYLLEKVK